MFMPKARLCHPLRFSSRMVTGSVGTVNDLIVSSPEGRDPGVSTAICPSDFLSVSSASGDVRQDKKESWVSEFRHPMKKGTLGGRTGSRRVPSEGLNTS